MTGLIDKDAELARLMKEMDKLPKESSRLSGKLNNEKFVANAPEAVVAKEREKLADFEAQLSQLSEQYGKIEALKKRRSSWLERSTKRCLLVSRKSKKRGSDAGLFGVR